MKSGRECDQILLDIPTFIPLSIIHLMTLAICVSYAIKGRWKCREGNEISKTEKISSDDVHICVPTAALVVNTLTGQRNGNTVSSDQVGRNDSRVLDLEAKTHSALWSPASFGFSSHTHTFWKPPKGEWFVYTAAPNSSIFANVIFFKLLITQVTWQVKHIKVCKVLSYEHFRILFTFQN